MAPAATSAATGNCCLWFLVANAIISTNTCTSDVSTIMMQCLWLAYLSGCGKTSASCSATPSACITPVCRQRGTALPTRPSKITCVHFFLQNSSFYTRKVLKLNELKYGIKRQLGRLRDLDYADDFAKISYSPDMQCKADDLNNNATKVGSCIHCKTSSSAAAERRASP